MPSFTDFLATHKPLLTNKKLKVRELDEETKGVFVAFVDEGKESYDVHISIDDNDELTKNECDCENKKPCVHQVFLAEYILNKKQNSTEKTKQRSTKKLPEYYSIVDSLEEFQLKNWLKTYLDSNKSVRFEFMLQFKENTFSAEALEQNIMEAISSTTNNRKKLDQLQIKNLLNIFDKINQPIYDKIKDSKDLNASILLTIMVSKVLNSHYNMIKSNSKKYESYLDNVFDLLTEPFKVATLEDFTTGIEVFIQNVKRERSIRSRASDYLYFLRDTLETKKRLVLMSQIKFMDNSTPQIKSYFSTSF
jgi:hypothetical protein